MAKRASILDDLLDPIKGFAGGAVKATAGIPLIGAQFQERAEALVNAIARRKLLDEDASVARGIASGIYDQGQTISDTRSFRARDEASRALSGGSVLKLESPFAEGATTRGVVNAISEGVGSFAPAALTALATKGKSAATQTRVGLATGGTLGAGAAAQQEGDRVRAMTDVELAALPVYAETLAQTGDPVQAREAIARRAEGAAALLTAPVSALGGAATGRIVGGAVPGALTKTLGSSRLSRGVATGLTSAAEEGVQEVGEGITQIAGANLATGEDRDVTAGSSANLALGALGGGPLGVASGLLGPAPVHTIQPERGTISRAAAKGVETGAIPNARIEFLGAPPAPIDVAPAPSPNVPTESRSIEQVGLAPSPIADRILDDENPTADPAAPAYVIPLPSGQTLEYNGYKNLSPRERTIETRAAQRLADDPQAAINAYRKVRGTDNGRIINTDEAREVFPEYSADATARSNNSLAVHEPASTLAKVIWEQELARPVDPKRKPLVVFMGGGSGSGKTSAIKRSGEESQVNKSYNNADIVYDSNLNNFDRAVERIEAAKASGRSAHVMFVNRPILASFDGVLKRAAKEDYGRTVPIDPFLETHIDSAKTIALLSEHYASDPDVVIDIINNPEGQPAAVGTVADVAEIANTDYNIAKESVNAQLEKARAEGRVPDRVWKAYRSDESPVAGGLAQGDAGGGDQQFGGGQQEEVAPRGVLSRATEPFVQQAQASADAGAILSTRALNRELRTRGEPTTDRVDAMKRLSSGQTLYGFHEQGGKPVPITVDNLDNFAEDQLLALPADTRGVDKQGKKNPFVPPAAIQRDDTLLPLQADDQAVMTKALAKLKRMGLPQSFVDKVPSFFAHNDVQSFVGHFYMYGDLKGAISLRSDRFYGDQAANVLRDLAHELAHSADYDLETEGFYSESSPRFAMTVRTDLETGAAVTEYTGDVIAELNAAWLNDTPLADELDYPFAGGYGESVSKVEAFAQAFMLYFTQRDNLMAHAPTTYRMIKEIIENENQQSASGDRAGAIQSALQSTGSRAFDLVPTTRAVAPARRGVDSRKQDQPGVDGRGSQSGDDFPDRGAILAELKSHPFTKFSGKVKGVYAVGSTAKGTARADSDVDVMIEVESGAKELQDKYRQRGADYFLKNNLTGKHDDVHPQWNGRRIDVYFTENAKADAEGPIVELVDKSVTESPAFKKWFGESKAVDTNGDPLVVYHGTSKKFTKFNFKNAPQKIVWFTTDRSSIDAGEVGAQGRGHVMELFASIKNPAGWAEYDSLSLDQLQDRGYDGALLPNDDGTVTGFVFESNQLKDAKRNRGAFDKNNPSILGSLDTRGLNSMPPPAQGFSGGTVPSSAMVGYLSAQTQQRLDGYRSALQKNTDKFRTMFQDYFLPVQRVQEAITRAGVTITEDTDVVGREEVYYGRTGEQLRQMEEKHVKPLVSEITRLGVKMEDLELYAYAKFAPDRNARISLINDKFPDGGSGMTDMDAAQILADYDASGESRKLAPLWERLQAMNEARVKTLEDAGLLSREEAAMWRSEPNYVPLKGIAEGMDEEPTFQRTGKGFSIGGKEAHRAMGRQSRATDIVANIIAQGEAAIIRAEKNRVAVSLLRLAQENPNDRLWSIDKPDQKPQFNKSTGEVTYKTDNLHALKDNVVQVKVDGEPHYITLHDKALAASMKNIGAAKMGAFLRSFASLNRFFSLTRTMLAPEFVLANFARDLQTASVNLAGEQSTELAARVVKDTPTAVKTMYAFNRNKNPGGDWGRYAQEFAEEGGMTSFVSQLSVEEQQTKIEGLLKEAQGGAVGGARKLVREVFDFISDANGAFENGVRLSAYANARRSGMSKQQAARLAKNLTVNFNKKGSVGPALNALYLFYNASVQGSMRFITAMKSPRVQKIMAATAVFGFTLAAMNRANAGDDDDGENRYDKIPDWEKARNLIFFIPGGDGKYVKIPMPYTYNLPFLAGSQMEAMVNGKGKPIDAAANLVNAMLTAFNPLGEIDVQADSALQSAKIATPTALDPFLDILANRNFFGAPIAPEVSPFDKVPDPDSQRYFASTNPGAIWLANKLNSLTGGDALRPGAIDVSPASMVYLFDYLTGGTGGFVERSATALMLTAKGEEVPTHKIPFYRVFAGELNDARIGQTYYAARDDVNLRLAMFKQGKAIGFDAPGEKEEAMAGKRLESLLRTSERQLKHLRDRRKEAQARGDDEIVKVLEARSRALQVRFARRYFSEIGVNE